MHAVITCLLSVHMMVIIFSCFCSGAGSVETTNPPPAVAVSGGASIGLRPEITLETRSSSHALAEEP